VNYVSSWISSDFIVCPKQLPIFNNLGNCDLAKEIKGLCAKPEYFLLVV
jgi:hypothetical protein